ncbi:cysteine desulfurase [Psychrobacillus psychrodurans]|jgi:cysteine desulfurase|uniref:cysteine desulfurase family protein n=1 Tax=Psychrobacillus TaxID=1221880 RepID=UPI0008DFA415|nr:cysteine desulfurase family protein [Psychrobacillus psychrodurans]MCK1996701.1 cysteine desulfurase [Psychrobacillus psychrodurans]MCZ8541804.1 cysteine desulfurase [Psychrobacillus psychrodurans]SFN01795.1 cysteine desulfurase [Psychrobacillus psychrodurans]
MIYFDNSATTKVHPEVLNTFVTVNEKFWANPASIHTFGHQTNELLQSAREQIAAILKTSSEKVYFTSGGTESNNLAIFGLAQKYKQRGKHVLISEIEHPSIIEAAKKLNELGFEVEWIPVDSEGIILLESVKKSIRHDTVLVSVMHVNNETGAIQPIEELSNIVRKKSRALIHMDAVQSFGKIPVNFIDLDVDSITISSHKIHGLKGSGLLALKKFIEIEPILYGGGQESGIRSGTTSVPLAVSTAKAMRLAMENLGSKAVKLQSLSDDLIEFLQSFSFIKVISPTKKAPHIISFSVKKMKGEVLINALQQQDVIVSTSSACSSRQTKTSHVLKAMHISDDYIKGVLRISLSTISTQQEVDQFKNVFKHVMNVIKGD